MVWEFFRSTWNSTCFSVRTLFALKFTGWSLRIHGFKGAKEFFSFENQRVAKWNITNITPFLGGIVTYLFLSTYTAPRLFCWSILTSIVYTHTWLWRSHGSQPQMMRKKRPELLDLKQPMDLAVPLVNRNCFDRKHLWSRISEFSTSTVTTTLWPIFAFARWIIWISCSIIRYDFVKKSECYSQCVVEVLVVAQALWFAWGLGAWKWYCEMMSNAELGTPMMVFFDGFPWFFEALLPFGNFRLYFRNGVVFKSRFWVSKSEEWCLAFVEMPS